MRHGILSCPATLLLLSAGLSAAGSAAPVFWYPSDPQLRVLFVRQCTVSASAYDPSETIRECTTLAISGDGRVEAEPAWGGYAIEEHLVPVHVLDDLLLSLAQLIGVDSLPSRSGGPEDPEAELIELRFAEYWPADPRRDPISDGVWSVRGELSDDAAEELSAFKLWWRLETGFVWMSVNAYPEICQPEARLERGLSIVYPVWCADRIAPSDRREWTRRFQEHLRERLQNLPRGRGVRNPPERSDADADIRQRVRMRPGPEKCQAFSRAVSWSVSRMLLLGDTLHRIAGVLSSGLACRPRGTLR